MAASGEKKQLALQIFRGLARRYELVLRYATLFQDGYWKKELLKQPPPPRTYVLDLGSGTGVLEESLGSRGCSVVGLDLTEAMVRLAQGKELPQVLGFLVGDAEHLQFRDGSFDLVLSCYVAKYCDLKRLLSEVARVLRPGGRLSLYDFSRPRGPFMLFHAYYMSGMLRLVGRIVRRIDPGVSFTYSALPSVVESSRWDEEMDTELLAHGFSDVGSRRLTGGVVTLFWATKTTPG